MSEPRSHLARDLEAMRYLDALDAGDLDAVAALWEDASHDPELERRLTELDGAMFEEIQGNHHAGRYSDSERNLMIEGLMKGFLEQIDAPAA